jgi:hypothetical protein
MLTTRASKPTPTDDKPDMTTKNKPRALTNEDMINVFIKSVRDRNLSLRTAQQYKKILERTINAGVDLTAHDQNDIIKHIKLQANPRTASNNSNAIQQVRIENGLPVDKIKIYREKLFIEINKQTKTNNSKLSIELPTYEYIIDKLNAINRQDDPRAFFINYLIINHGLRNKDMNARYYDTTGYDEHHTGNNIYKIENGYKLVINDYKTAKRYGAKIIYVRNEKFNDAMKHMWLADGEYIFKLKITPWNAKKDKSGFKKDDQISQSSMNVYALALSIDKFGETKIFKIVIGYLLTLPSRAKLRQISKDRGTSMSVILEVYDMDNN